MYDLIGVGYDLREGQATVAAPTHYLKKRDLLWNPKTAAATLSATGWEYFKREAYSDALDFFERAHDEEGVKAVHELALREGDPFLLARMERFDHRRVTPDQWERVARIARERGKSSMADFAERKLRPVGQPGAEAVKPGEKPLDEVSLGEMPKG